MKYFLLLFVIVAMQANAQNPLNFNKRFVECENKWVALKTAKDSVYAYGFIYLDLSAGLSVREEGSFKITKENVFVPTKLSATATYTARLQDNQVKVAWLPSEKFKELEVTDPPSWLAIYKADTTSAAWLFRWGFVYNGGNEITKALSYLERVKKIDPKYPGLDFEFIYAYNASNQYDKAIAIINDAIKSRPNDGNLYKELVFAQVNSNQLNKAEETYKQGIAHCGIDVKIEMAFNILYIYFQQKNKEKFNYWADDMKSWLPPANPRINDIAKMKELIEK
jgi:tetratricopeptide (TPR) repeat protein